MLYMVEFLHRRNGNIYFHKSLQSRYGNGKSLFHFRIQKFFICSSHRGINSVVHAILEVLDFLGQDWMRNGWQISWKTGAKGWLLCMGQCNICCKFFWFSQKISSLEYAGCHILSAWFQTEGNCKTQKQKKKIIVIDD